jgi:hypothetical protein
MMPLHARTLALAIGWLGAAMVGCSASASPSPGDGTGAAGDDAAGGSAPDAGGALSDGSGATHGSDAGGTPDSDAGVLSGDAGGTVDASDGGWWRPSSATPVHFHWQLSTKFAVPADVLAGPGPTVYDIDGETNDAATVAQLHALGPDVKVVCYVDVGTYENFRSDAAQFPASVLGSSNGWPGEQWVDVRQQSVLLPIMKHRFVDWCSNKGFDAIEPDNLDGWANSPGFPFTEADNISYDLAVAALGHSLGLSVGLKNLPQNAASMEPSFDWALDEQCFQYGECDGYTTSFLAKGKAVWDVEYTTAPSCAQAGTAHLNAQQRDLNLVAPGVSGYSYQPCVPDSKTTW